MGQVLHGCATTTEAVRRAIQNSQESLRALAKRYGINQKSVAKWRERETVADLPTGCGFRRSRPPVASFAWVSFMMSSRAGKVKRPADLERVAPPRWKAR